MHPDPLRQALIAHVCKHSPPTDYPVLCIQGTLYFPTISGACVLYLGLDSLRLIGGLLEQLHQPAGQLHAGVCSTDGPSHHSGQAANIRS